MNSNFKQINLQLGSWVVCIAILLATTSFSIGKEADKDDFVEHVIRQMSDYLKSCEQFIFTAAVTVEYVLDSGQKLEFERKIETFMRRPNKVRANFYGEDDGNRFWYDGKTITLLSESEMLYAKMKAPEAIDAALDFAMDRYGVSVPVADLLFSDPYESYMQNVVTGKYVGRDKVDGELCYHLAFTQESIDWQIWIEDGAMPVPRKLVITYKDVEGMPQYRAVFNEWNLTPRLPDLLFEFKAPAEAVEIEFLSSNE